MSPSTKNRRLKVATLLNDMYEKLMPAVIPESAQGEPPPLRPNLSVDEARAVTRQLLDTRRQAHQGSPET